MNRKHRLTESNFGRVFNRIAPPTESMLSTILNPKDLLNVKSIKHVKKNENEARTVYIKKMEKNISNFSVFDC